MQVQEALFHPTAHSMGYAGATAFLPFVYLAARIYVFSRCLTASCENFTCLLLPVQQFMPIVCVMLLAAKTFLHVCTVFLRIICY